MRRLCSTMLVGSFAFIAGCGSGSSGGNNNPTDPGGNNTCPAGTVCMASTTFSPSTLTVSQNTTVTFSNTSGVNHNIVFDTPLPAATTDIGLVSQGHSATRTFATAGTYNFHCTIHPSTMIGKVIVQ